MYRIIWTSYGKPYIAYDLHLNEDRSELCYYSPMTHTNESINISKIYRIETAENGKYTAQISDRIPTPAADNIIDCEIKSYLALSWSKNSNFVLYLPTFLDVCTKSDLNRVLTMIKQFSGAVMDDINKLLFTLETVLTSAARKYSKIKEWILNSKIYQEFFGSAEAEQLAAGDNMSLYDLHDTYTNYPTTKKSVYYTYSSDIPIISGEYCQGYVIEKICNVFAGVIKSCILTHCYDFTSVENLTNYVMYMLSKSGKVQFEYRIVSFPESIPDTMDSDDISSIRDFIFRNTVINIKKPQKATKFDIDVISAEIKQFWNDRKEKAESAPAADTAARESAAPDVSIVYMPPLFGIRSYYADIEHLNDLLLIQYVIPPAALMSAHGRPCCRYPAQDTAADVNGRYLASWTRSRISLQGDRPEGYRPPGIPSNIFTYPAAESVRPRPPNIKNLSVFKIPF